MSLKSVTPAGGAFGGALAQQAGTGGFTGAYPSGSIGLMSGQGGGGLPPGMSPGTSMGPPGLQGGPTPRPSVFGIPSFGGGPVRSGGAGGMSSLYQSIRPSQGTGDVMRTHASPFMGGSY